MRSQRDDDRVRLRVPGVRDQDVDGGASGHGGVPGLLRILSAAAAVTRRLVALAVLTVLGWTSPAVAETRVTIGQGALNATSVALWVAADRGYFRAHGIQADLRWIRGGALATAALLSGEIAFASMALAQVVGPVSRGADLVAVANLTDRFAYRLVSAPSIRDAEGLKGRKVAIATLSGAGYVAARLALRQLGLDPARDRIALIQIGGEYERLAALKAGTVDAAVLAPALAASLPAPPYRTLVDLSRDRLSWQHTSLVTRRALLRSSPQVVDAVLRAVAEGAAFALDPGQKEAVKAVIAKELRLTDPAILEHAYRDVLLSVAWKPIPRPEGAAGVLRLLAEFEIVDGASHLEPLDVMDPTPMLRLDREGFLDRLRPGH